MIMARTRIHHFDGFSIKRAGVDIKLDMDRVSENFNRAQYQLDSMVMQSMEPFMPKASSQFINTTKAMSAARAGKGEVVAAAPPFGRFLYEGKTMVDIQTGSPWARKGAKKVLVSRFGGKTKAKPNLSFSKSANPNAQAHWFDAAKEKHGEAWVEKVKEIAGGGE